MKTLINALADAAQSKTNYQDFQEILSKVLEVDSDADGQPTRVAIGVNGTGCYIEIKEDDIYFVTPSDRISLRQMGMTFSMASAIQRSLFPNSSTGSDEGLDIHSSSTSNINIVDAPIIPNHAQTTSIINSPFLLASQPLSAFRAVAVINGSLTYADISNSSQVKNVIGITLDDVATGAIARIASQGLIINSAWNFNPNLDQPLLLDANGVFSQRNPATTVEKFIGEAVKSDTILLYQFPRIL